METTVQNYNYPEKTLALLFSPGKVWIKNYLRIRALGEQAKFVRLPNDESSE